MTSTLDPTSATPPTSDPRKARKRFMNRRPNEPLPLFFARIALPLLLVLLIVVFSVAAPDTFATVDNARRRC